jgi:membrane protein implicated in regulation of membrane protease activity
MKMNEDAVFKWVVIVAGAAGVVIAVTLLTSQLVGAVLFGLLVVAAGVYAYRWWQGRRRAKRATESARSADNRLH